MCHELVWTINWWMNHSFDWLEEKVIILIRIQENYDPWIPFLSLSLSLSLIISLALSLFLFLSHSLVELFLSSISFVLFPRAFYWIYCWTCWKCFVNMNLIHVEGRRENGLKWRIKSNWFSLLHLHPILMKMPNGLHSLFLFLILC